jgi:hypothetical protein
LFREAASYALLPFVLLFLVLIPPQYEEWDEY